MFASARWFLDLLINGNATWSGSFTGTGVGSLTLNAGTQTIGVAGATFDTPLSMMRWTLADISGSGTLLVGAASRLTVAIPAGNSPNLTTTLRVAGQFDIVGQGAGSGQVDVNTTGVLETVSGGSINLFLPASATAIGFSGTAGALINTGTINKNNANTATISTPLNSTGTVNVGTGTLTLSGAITQASTSTLTGGTWATTGTLDFSTAPNITTLGSGASVTYSGAAASFPKFASVNNIQGTLNLLNKNFLGSATVGIVNSGTFNINGGSFAQTTPRTFTQSGGSTNLSNAGSIASSISSVTINGGAFTGVGTVSSATFTNNSGTVVPGASPGILTIAGNYVQARGNAGD